MKEIREHLGDERGLVVKTLVILLLFIVVGGVALVDTGSILFAKFKVADAAQEASFEAAATFKSTGNENAALETAFSTVEEAGAGRVSAFLADPATGNVSVTVTKRVSTIAVRYIGFLKGFERVESTETSPAPP